MALEEGLYADVDKLRAFTDRMAQELAIARNLTDQLKVAKRYAETADDLRVRGPLQKAEKLSNYCAAMKNWAEDSCTDLEHLSGAVGAKIEEATEDALRRFRVFNF